MAETLGAAFGVFLIVALTIISLTGPASDAINQAIAGASSASETAGGNAGSLVSLVKSFGGGIVTTILSVLSSLDEMHARLQVLYPELRPPSFEVVGSGTTS